MIPNSAGATVGAALRELFDSPNPDDLHKRALSLMHSTDELVLMALIVERMDVLIEEVRRLQAGARR